MRSILIVLVLATPAFSGEFFAVGEALCWRPYSADFKNDFDSSLSVNHDWDAGFRAGVGIQIPLSWRASWVYTSFSADDTRVWRNVGNISAAASYGDLDYQVHDFEVGQVLYCNSVCQVEGFGGFRWGQIDYTLQDVISGGSIVNLDSNTDSYGLRLGGKATCWLTQTISIFGQGAASGFLSTTDNRGDSTTAAWNLTDDHETHGVDALAGVAWNYGLLEVAAGYEWNWWADIIQRRGSTSTPDYDNLLLEGAFLRMTARY